MSATKPKNLKEALGRLGRCVTDFERDIKGLFDESVLARARKSEEPSRSVPAMWNPNEKTTPTDPSKKR
jgi:hypothetical protein